MPGSPIFFLNQTLILLDVDATIITHERDHFNHNLFKILQLFDLTRVSFLTRMDLTNDPSLDTSRIDARAELASYGISVENVFTPLDLQVKQAPGYVYPQLLMPIEEAARALKNTNYFGALEVDSIQRKEVIINRFRIFKQAYNAAKKPEELKGLPGIDEENEQLMKNLLRTHKAGNDWLDENRLDNKITKGQVRQQLSDWKEPVLFIDDAKNERTPYSSLNPNDLVLRPPHGLGFDHKNEACYLSCASFVRKLIPNTQGISQFNEAKVQLLLELAQQDREAGFTADALYLYKLAYIAAYNLDRDYAQEIKKQVRVIEESDLSLAGKDNLSISDYGLNDDEGTEALTDIQSLHKDLQEFNEALLNLKNSVPSAFQFGIWMSLKRMIFGLDETKEMIDEALERLSLAEINLNVSPTIVKYCIMAMDQCFRDCASSTLKKELKARILPLPADVDCLKDIIKDRIAHGSYATGLLGLTGVNHAENNRKIPQGVDALLSKQDLEGMIVSAQQSTNHYSFLRSADTAELYDELKTLNQPIGYR